MSKEKRQIEKDDLLSPDIYSKSRKQIRKDLVEFKKDRRIALGPYATFYFESFETMVAQVQEMLHIEKGGVGVRLLGHMGERGGARDRRVWRPRKVMGAKGGG